MGKTAMTTFIDFLEKSKNEKQEFNYDLIIAFATELRDTMEKHDLLRAYMGYYDPKMSDAEFRKLLDEAKHYYKLKYGDGYNPEKEPQ
jgi:hypothetical protein